MEREVLRVLDFDLTQPTIKTFLRRYIKAASGVPWAGLDGRLSGWREWPLRSIPVAHLLHTQCMHLTCYLPHACLTALPFLPLSSSLQARSR